MIPPASAEQRAAMPRWMHEVAAMRIPHVVGLPVVDWLYCGTYGDLHGWIVTHVAPGSGGFEQHVGTVNGSTSCGSAGAYYIADMTTDLGRDHVRRWCEEHGLPMPGCQCDDVNDDGPEPLAIHCPVHDPFGFDDGADAPS